MFSIGNQIGIQPSTGTLTLLGLLAKMIEELALSGKLTPQNWSKMKPFGLGLNFKMPKTTPIYCSITWTSTFKIGWYGKRIGRSQIRYLNRIINKSQRISYFCFLPTSYK